MIERDPSTNEHSEISSSVDLAIVGAGMVGLSFALMLCKKNIAQNILIFDERSLTSNGRNHLQASFDGRSTAISAGTSEVLNQLGIWTEIEKQAEPIKRVKVSDKNKFGFSEFSAQEAGLNALGYVVENSVLGTVLKKHIDNEARIRVCAPSRVEKLSLKQGGASLKVVTPNSEKKAEQQVDCSLLVLADGAESRLAKSIGIGAKRHDYGQHALIMNVSHTVAHDGAAFEHFSESGPLAFLPLPAIRGMNRSAVVWTHEADQTETLLNCEKQQLIEKLQSQFSERLGEITEIGKREVYPLSLIEADEQFRQHVVLVGNAAHFLHPVAGQGFNLALRDCVALVNSLFDAKKSGRALGNLVDLEHYIEQRQLDQWMTTELSHSFISLFASANPAKQIVRTAALSFLNKVPETKSLFFSQMMGKGMNGVRLK